jgi:hypothetical protein
MTTQQHDTNNSTNIVGVHYKIGKKLGEGSFGIIYEGKMDVYFLKKREREKKKRGGGRRRSEGKDKSRRE